MRRNRVLIVSIAVILLLCVLNALWKIDNQAVGLSFWIAYEDGQERVDLWLDPNGGYYAFFPSGVDLSDVYIELQSDDSVWLDGRLLTNGMTCEDIRWDIEYICTYSSGGKQYNATVIFMHSGNVPTIFLDTQSGSMKYIHHDKDYRESGMIRVYSQEGHLEYLGEVESVKGRGNDSWVSYEKKSYSLQFAQDVELLNLGAAKKWALLSNASDPSHIRNKLAFTLAENCGLSYTPDTQWADVFLNGEYAGLYLLSEVNEIHEERIDISDTEGVVVSLELEERLKDQNIAYVITEEKQSLRVHNPNEITNMQEVQQVFQMVENAILSENGIDPISGKTIDAILDIDSWAKKYVLEELVGNVDALRVSQFFYYDASEIVYAGPAWDYDLSMGNRQIWQLHNPNVVIANRLIVKNGVSAPWFYYLCQRQEFWAYVMKEYQTFFKPMLVELLHCDIEAFRMRLSQAANMNQVRWSAENSMDEELLYIREYLLQRIDFLDNYWQGGESYCVVQIDDGRNSNYAYWMVIKGTKIPELPVLDVWGMQTFVGWYRADTDEPFDITEPLVDNIVIRAKWEDMSTKKFGQMVKLLPVGVIAALGLILLLVDVRNMSCRNSRTGMSNMKGRK